MESFARVQTDRRPTDNTSDGRSTLTLTLHWTTGFIFFWGGVTLYMYMTNTCRAWISLSQLGVIQKLKYIQVLVVHKIHSFIHNVEKFGNWGLLLCKHLVMAAVSNGSVFLVLAKCVIARPVCLVTPAVPLVTSSRHGGVENAGQWMLRSANSALSSLSLSVVLFMLFPINICWIPNVSQFFCCILVLHIMNKSCRNHMVG